MTYTLLYTLAVVFGLVSVSDAFASGQKQAYFCQPALLVFCQNIHVSCSGRTHIATVPFQVSILGSLAQVSFADAKSSIVGHVRNGPDTVVRLAGSQDWIRIEPDGKYSYRIYRKGIAAMSYGMCLVPKVPHTGEDHG